MKKEEQAQILRIVVASPEDVKPERNTLDGIVNELNRGIAADRGLQLKLVRWETDAYPGFNVDGPQGLIDPILRIEDCQVLIGIFWKRFGSQTKDDQSGTEHEFKTAYKTWKIRSRPQILVYFNQRSAAPKSSEEADQWRRVLEFKENFPKEGLWWPYKGKSEFESLVRSHLTNFIRDKYQLPATPQLSISDHKIVQGKASNQSTIALETRYLEQLHKQVRNIYIFGEQHDLKKIFVDLNIIEEYERPLMHIEYLDTMSAQLKQERDIFAPDEKADETEASVGKKNTRGRMIKPDELLRGTTHAIITGAPGCGKTTLVKYLTMKANEAKGRFPVFFELKLLTQDAFRQAGNSLPNLLFDLAIATKIHLDYSERQLFQEYFFARLGAHDVVICLDGLDEISDPDVLSQLCNCISTFIRDYYGDNIVIITTRTHALQRIEGMKQMEIAALNHLQIEEFLNHYYGKDPATISILKAYRRRTQLRELMRVPFLLAVIFQLLRTKNVIIENRLELYRQISYQLGRNLDREKAALQRVFLIKDPEGVLKLNFLSYLACERMFIESFQHEDTTQEAMRLIFTGNAILDKAKQFIEKSNLTHISPYDLASDVKSTALLREVGTDAYAFGHFTIQEYLAASALKEHRDFETIFCRAYFNPTLVEGEALPMAIGMVNNPSHVYEFLENLPESITFANLRLRARGLGYVSTIGQRLLTGLADRLANLIAGKQIEDEPFEPAIRRSFASATGKPLEAITERLLPLLLQSADSELRLKTVAVLEQLGGEGAITALIKILEKDEIQLPNETSSNRPSEKTTQENPELTGNVAQALGRLGSERSVEALTKLLKDSNYFVCTSAIDALGQIGGKAAAISLMDAVKSLNVELRKRSADALAYIGGESEVNAVGDLLKDQDVYTRRRAIAALGRIGGEKAISVLDMLR